MIELPRKERDFWWLALYGRGETRRDAGSSEVVVARAPNGTALRLRGDLAERLPSHAVEDSLAVVWQGVLHNRDEIAAELGISASTAPDDARLLLTAYRLRGRDFFSKIRGMFALIVWDLAADALYAVRDPIGLHPLFYADASEDLALSDSIEAILRAPGVSRRPSRASMAMHIASLPMRKEVTFFDAVRRVPAGHALYRRNGTRDVYRHWDPAPPDKPMDWVTADELPSFGGILDRAVERCQKLGPAGIFLSGGLDSGTVAAVAVDNSRRLGIAPPIAFSLVFPESSECNEESIQRGVAASLGLEQVAIGFDEAIGQGELLSLALEISGRMPAPLDNFWLPAYYSLAQRAKRLGCDRVLTGIGGDEWLAVTPMLAADLIPALDFAGLYRLWRVIDASYKLPKLAMTKNVLWSCGVRPILGEAGAALLRRLSPALLEAKRRASRRIPPFLCSDPSLREEIEAQLAPVVPVTEAGGFYRRELRIPLDHYLVSTEFEEDFEVSHRGGVRRLHPYLDADLLGFLLRTPPDLLCQGGRSKGLVRGLLAERFPTLGFDRQRKVTATHFIQSRVLRAAEGLSKKFGNRLALADYGVIDAKRWQLTWNRTVADNDRHRLHFVWLVSTIETWLRSRLP